MKSVSNFSLCSSLMVILMLSIACRSNPEGSFDEQKWFNAIENARLIEAKAEKVGEFEEVYKHPNLSGIDEEYIYILDSEAYTINAYGKKDFKLKVRFGRKGEGPGEFTIIQGFQVYHDFIYVNSPGKSSYFSKKGELLKEIKNPPHLIPCLPCGENYITNEYAMPDENNISSPYIEKKIVLVGPGFETREVLFQKRMNTSMTYNKETGEPTIRLFPDYVGFQIYNDRIYMGYANTEDFTFTIFNADGDILKEIKRPIKKREIPGIIKESILKKKHQTIYNQRQLKILFYNHYPAFANFYVADDRIYISLFPGKERQVIVVLDLNGALIDTLAVSFDPIVFERSSYRFLYKNLVYGGYRYFLEDNEETSQWELWRSPILPITGEKKQVQVEN